MKISLYIKFVFLGIALVSVTAVFLFVFANRLTRQTLESQIADEFSQRGKAQIQAIDRFMQQRKTDIQTATLNPILRSGDRFSHDEINGFLKDLNLANPIYTSFSFFDTNRIRLADSKGLSVGKQHSLTKYWRKVDFRQGEDAFVQDFSRSESVGKIVIHFGSVVRDNRNRPAGLLVARVPVEHLYNVFATTDPWFKKYDAEVILLDAQGRNLYTNRDFYAQFEKPSPFEGTAKAISASAFFHTDTSLVFMEKDGGFLNYTGQGWTLVFQVPKKRLYSPLDDVQRNLVLAFAGILAGAILVSIAATKLLTQPIQKLSETALAITEGNLDASFLIRTGDETQTLGLHLQKMSRMLKARLDDQTRLGLELQRKNNQITDSIRYARRIQNALFAVNGQFSMHFKESFVLNLPKDIVTGDFFFLRNWPGHSLLLVGDCTGHGVPGALMVMRAYTFLAQLLEQTRPDESPDLFQNLISGLGGVLDSEEDSFSGMDYGICLFNFYQKELLYAGAGIDLLLENGAEGWKRIPSGRRFAMLRNLNERRIQVNAFPLKAGMKCLLATDGLTDQIGEKSGRKWLKRSLDGFLAEQGPISLEELKSNLSFRWQEWKGKGDQIDDVMVVGVLIP